jgi:hypothetical protein
VQKPPYIDRQLLRLRPRKEHAEIEGLKKMVLVDPSFFLDQVLVHHRYLTCRTTETYESELKPVLECLFE